MLSTYTNIVKNASHTGSYIREITPGQKVLKQQIFLILMTALSLFKVKRMERKLLTDGFKQKLALYYINSKHETL